MRPGLDLVRRQPYGHSGCPFLGRVAFNTGMDSFAFPGATPRYQCVRVPHGNSAR
jgi:hypothetical protein